MVKATNKTKGFTLVELIIVIAVIGVLAAILIPVFSNVIAKANEKSALSDARNALTLYLAEITDGEPVDDTLFFVEKAGKMYLFGYYGATGELVSSASNPYDLDTYRGTATMENKVSAFINKLVANGEIVAANANPQNERIPQLADGTCIWSGYSLVTLPEGASSNTARIFVTISSEGTLVLTRKAVTIYDADADGALTINDALIVTHKANYPGGESGYETANSQWGLSLKKLWGVENGGSYGYYVNNNSAWSLVDPIADNDYLYAFSYADAATYTDAFSYFDVDHAEVSKGDSVTLTLSYYTGYDPETYASIFEPLSGATITIDGAATSYTTNAQGKVTIPMNTAGTFTIGATSGAVAHLVPPVCVVTVQNAAKIYVTISSEGTLVLTRKAVTVTDADADGSLTINDALIVTHKENYSGGESGYETANSQWGLSLKKLWGVENGGSYGYYVNNNSAWSLVDPVTDNDYLYAFSYADAATYTDSFSYFNINHAEVAQGGSVTLTLSYYTGYDPETYASIFAPLAGAVITIDGAATSYTTDANGQVTIPMNTAGTFIIGATTTAVTHLVPPVCEVVVSAS